jgi:SAM-dependent methyltransferase
VTDSAELWSDAAFTHRLSEVSWMAALPVLLHLNERSTGDPARDWLTAWAPRFMPGQDLRVLVLGCGEGWLERALVRHYWIAQVDACDFAAEAVDRARALAPPKIDYRVLDLNRDSIDGSYDVVVAHAVLHHIENLEHAFDQIDRALKPEGTLIVNEYVGPNRFQYGDDVLAIMNALLGALPPHLRRSMMTGRIYETRERPTVEEMIRNDPSEAVRAEELLPMLAARYEVLDRRDLGGTLMQHLLYDIVGNFRFDDPLGRSLLEMMLTFEGALVDEGRIASDFALCAARKKGAPPLHERDVELPPLPPEAFETMRDPLRKARRVVPDPSTRVSAAPRSRRKLAPWQLHLLRLALLAEEPHRTPLNPRSRVAEAAERIMFTMSSEAAFDWILARTANADARAMLETMQRLYVPA